MIQGYFKGLLRLYPRQFRHRYGSEQLDFMRQEWTACTAGSGKLPAMVFLMRAFWDHFTSALRVRWVVMTGNGPANRGQPGEEKPPRTALLEGLVQDVSFSVRTLRKQLPLTLVIVGVLGVGIGASTTLFSAVNSVLLRPLPYPEQDRLVFLGSTYSTRDGISPMSIPQFMDVTQGTELIEDFGAVRGRALDLVGDGEPERVAVAEVSPGYFRVLGVSPALGPGFLPDTPAQDQASNIIVSDGLWKRRWGADPEIIGRSVLASDGRTPELQTYTIVGILPPDFENPPPLENRFSRLPPADIWAQMPLGSEMYGSPRTNWTVRTVGRLRVGASLEAANAELEALGLVLNERFPEVYAQGERVMSLGARRLLEQMVGSRRSDLLILLSATGLLLLIACANVAGLMIARALDRVRELGIRAALGAGRGRLFRQLVTESMVLAFLAGAGGVGLAFLGTGAFRTFGPADFPRLAGVGLDLRVLAFGLGVVGVTGFLFGVGPALTFSREDGSSVLAAGTRGSTSSGRTIRIRGGLVVLEVALALVLLSGCGLLTRSVLRLQGRNPGVDTERLALMQIRLLPSYDEDQERITFFSRLKERIQALPGVEAVSYVSDPPMDFSNWAPFVWIEEDVQNETPTGMGRIHPVGMDYFETMGIPILGGRAFAEADNAGAPGVAIVSRTMAEAFWPGQDPLGKRLGRNMEVDGSWATVVGVAGDIRQRSLGDEPVLDFYVPHDQAAASPGQFMAIRTAGDPMEMATVLREAVWNLDDRVPVPEITTMEARMAKTLRLPRFRALLLASFAGVALLLAGAGLYGTLLYTVSRRAPEVGLRMALGAETRDVVGLVLRQGMVPVAVGLGLGMAGSLAATRVLESVLFETTPNDPLTFVVVVGALAGVCLLAAFIPARKAAMVDPQEALRAE